MLNLRSPPFQSPVKTMVCVSATVSVPSAFEVRGDLEAVPMQFPLRECAGGRQTADAEPQQGRWPDRGERPRAFDHSVAGSMISGCRPVSVRTSSTMCSVPPGPSPGSPFQRVTNEVLLSPHESAE